MIPDMTPDRPPIVVLDTNVLLDWLVFADARAQPIGSALAAGQVLWRATAPMRVEFAHMLGHRSLERWAPDGERALACFDLLATLSDPAPAVPSRPIPVSTTARALLP